MRALVENLRAAYAERMKHLPWMTPATKKAALEKLATFRPKIGYPDKWRDYSALDDRQGRCLRQSACARLCSTGSARWSGWASRRIATSGA